MWKAQQDKIDALVEALEKAQAINAAAEKLVRCKGRYHSELNYLLFGGAVCVNTQICRRWSMKTSIASGCCRDGDCSTSPAHRRAGAPHREAVKRFCPRSAPKEVCWSETEV